MSHKRDFNGNNKVSFSHLELHPGDLGASRGRCCLPQALPHCPRALVSHVAGTGSAGAAAALGGSWDHPAQQIAGAAVGSQPWLQVQSQKGLSWEEP